MSDAPKFALLKFALTPVQGFIAAAKTTRDLWSGSYILSWLTLHGIKKILDDCKKGATIIYPDVEHEPLLKDLQAVEAAKQTSNSLNQTEIRKLLSPTIPNIFLARVPAERASDLVTAVPAAVREEWRNLCAGVKEKLGEDKWKDIAASYPAWNEDWENQVEHFWDIFCVALPCGAADVFWKTHSRLAAAKPADLRDHAADFDLISRLLAARKAVRQVPPPAPADDARGKCTLLGSLAQMGPQGYAENKRFWEEAARDKGRQVIEGGRIRAGERLCAVSLVKRTAWALYLSGKLEPSNAQFHKQSYFPDTATVAAKFWLEAAGLREWPELFKQNKWNGQWLHWNNAKQEDEQPCDDKLFGRIREQRVRLCRPPAYYALLMMDGDRMGERVREAAKRGPELHRELSGQLVAFARETVLRIVEDKHKGELIYAGGDDVLAMLPTESALACADEIRKAFGGVGIAGETAAARTMSAGLVVAHYKEDLRLVLETARAAEKRAKNSGKDALAITALIRSGAHETVVCKWDGLAELRGFVKAFGGAEASDTAAAADYLARKQQAASDRWVYQLSDEAPALAAFHGMTHDVFEDEIRRILKRSEGTPADLPDKAAAAWKRYRQQTGSFKHYPPLNSQERWARDLQDFCILLRCASFLARGQGR